MIEPMDYKDYLEDILENTKYAAENYGWLDTQCLASAFGDLEGHWEKYPLERVLALVATGRYALELGIEKYHPDALFRLWTELVDSDQLLHAAETLPPAQREEFEKDARRLAEGIKSVLGG